VGYDAVHDNTGLQSFSSCYSSSSSSKVIDLGANRKQICNFLLIITSNFGLMSCRFRDIDAFSSNISRFHHHALVWRPLAEERTAIST